MPTQVIGPVASGTIISIASDADFVLSVRSDGDPYALDAEISLRFPMPTDTVTWVATIDPDDLYRASWNVDEVEVAALLALGKPRTARVHYEHDTVDLLWDVWQVKVL